MLNCHDVLKKSDPLTREKCESMINRLIREIVNVYHLYNPDGKYLSIAYVNEDNDEYVSCNNHYFSADEETGEPAGDDFDHPINFHTYAPLKIKEETAYSSAFKQMIVTGFTSEQM